MFFAKMLTNDVVSKNILNKFETIITFLKLTLTLIYIPTNCVCDKGTKCVWVRACVWVWEVEERGREREWKYSNIDLAFDRYHVPQSVSTFSNS